MTYYGAIQGNIPESITDPYIFKEICCEFVSKYPRYEICGCPALSVHIDCINGCSHTRTYFDERQIIWRCDRKAQLQLSDIHRKLHSSVSFDETAMFLFEAVGQLIECFQRYPYTTELQFVSSQS